jgi:pimeloyl-ACP methyl ester carboxylesterase
MIRFAHNGSVRLAHYERGGPERPPLLLIRGLGRTAEHWSPAFLSALDPHFRVLLMDNRGVGRSSVPRPPYRTRDMADDAAAVLDAFGVDRAHVFGISLGGMIAQELALRHPSRVERLVLGCTRAGGKLSPRMSVRAALGLVWPMRLPVEAAVRETARVVLSERFFREHPEVVDDWVRLVREYPLQKRGVIGQLLAGARHDTSSRLGKLSIPTLVLSGDADLLIDIENSRRLARALPDAGLAILAGAGHDFPTEEPQATAQAVTEFLFQRSSSP